MLGASCACACVSAMVPQLSVLTGPLGPSVARRGQLGIIASRTPLPELGEILEKQSAERRLTPTRGGELSFVSHRRGQESAARPWVRAVSHYARPEAALLVRWTRNHAAFFLAVHDRPCRSHRTRPQLGSIGFGCRVGCAARGSYYGRAVSEAIAAHRQEPLAWRARSVETGSLVTGASPCFLEASRGRIACPVRTTYVAQSSWCIGGSLDRRARGSKMYRGIA